MLYTLKNGVQVESIPVGRSSVKIGEVSPNGMLTICDRGPAPSSGRGATVICKCCCGNYTLLKLQAFKDGTTKSCGCYNKKKHQELCKELGKKKIFKNYSSPDLNTNPYYDFIKSTEEITPMGVKWIIKCRECGKEYIEIPNQLISDNRRKGNNPCSCWRKTSKGILKLIDLFKKMNIQYNIEYTFPTCLGLKNKPLKFDFYLPQQDILIEYDGEQHFEDKGMFGDKNHQQKFELQQKYDKIKNDWCLKNNKKLIRISYKDYNNINQEYIERILNG